MPSDDRPVLLNPTFRCGGASSWPSTNPRQASPGAGELPPCRAPLWRRATIHRRHASSGCCSPGPMRDGEIDLRKFLDRHEAVGDRRFTGTELVVFVGPQVTEP